MNQRIVGVTIENFEPSYVLPNENFAAQINAESGSIEEEDATILVTSTNV